MGTRSPEGQRGTMQISYGKALDRNPGIIETPQAPLSDRDDHTRRLHAEVAGLSYALVGVYIKLDATIRSQNTGQNVDHLPVRLLDAVLHPIFVPGEYTPDLDVVSTAWHDKAPVDVLSGNHPEFSGDGAIGLIKDGDIKAIHTPMNWKPDNLLWVPQRYRESVEKVRERARTVLTDLDAKHNGRMAIKAFT